VEGGATKVARLLGMTISFATSFGCLEAHLQAGGCLSCDFSSLFPLKADELQQDLVGSPCLANVAQQQSGLAVTKASRTKMMFRRRCKI
jgi:hypothetical protein